MSATVLRNTHAVRQRAQALLARARRGESAHWAVDDTALPAAVAEVVAATRQRYPDLAIPYHSRWRHFEAGGVDRKASLDKLLAHQSENHRARARIDLAVVSVLLDAGAGPDWAYQETTGGPLIARSEGLGVASFHAFAAGLFSSDPSRPLQVDGAGLRALTRLDLETAFQVSASNPLVGLDGRVALLHRLGDALLAQPEVFGRQGRPGKLFDHLIRQPGASDGSATPRATTVQAHAILVLLLDTLSGIWPAGNQLGGVPLGDCWPHPAVEAQDGTAGWMPFHKLSQWLTYSLLEPFEWAGVRVEGLDALTGLPEYRNGGLLIDSGVLRLKNPADAQRPLQAGDEIIVEWRALTVALLDELAPEVRAALGRTDAQMPLACVLEGGTWAAGRVMAQRLRGGTPPLNIASDGTVF